MSAYAVWALSLAQDAQVDLPENMLRRGEVFCHSAGARKIVRICRCGCYAIHAAGREDLSLRQRRPHARPGSSFERERHPQCLRSSHVDPGGSSWWPEEGGQALGATIGKWRDSARAGAGSVLASGIRSGDSEPTAHWERMACFVTGPMVASEACHGPEGLAGRGSGQ